MTYEQALAYWFSHVNFEQRAPASGDLKLDRMRALLARLGSPHQRLRVVHVAGSKGKGSTAAVLAAVLARAGYRTALFTSPHLTALEERFQVDGRPISPVELAQLLTDVREAVEGAPPLAGGPPTFFEIATAVGLLHFVRRRADVAVLEVGLGGRLDSTNVCRPVVSVITSISFDHTAILGDRLASIAREKAGIIKPGRPVVSGATDPEARAVIEAVARGHRAPLAELGVDFQFRYHPGEVTSAGLRRPRVEVVTPRRRWPTLELNLLGEHQGANAAVAVATVEALRAQGLHLPDRAVVAGMREVEWPARLEVVRLRPLTVLDCAHNVASAEALVKTLLTAFAPARRWLVFAGSADKDVPGMFRAMAPHFAGAFLTRYSISLRATAPEQLAAAWAEAGGAEGRVFAHAEYAWRAALAAAGPDDLICITGSVFLAGELRPILLGAGTGAAPATSA